MFEPNRSEPASRVDAHSNSCMKHGEEIRDEVSDRLSRHKCIAFAFHFEDEMTIVPSFATAVQLLFIAVGLSEPIKEGLTWGLPYEATTPEAIAAASKEVEDCVMLAEAIQAPFTFLVHVHGQYDIDVYFKGERYETPFQSLADAIADEISLKPLI